MMRKHFPIYFINIIIYSFIISVKAGPPINLNQFANNKANDTSLVNKYIKYSFEEDRIVPFAIYKSIDAFSLANKLNYSEGIEKINKKVSGYLLPVSGYLFPVIGNRLPVTGNWLQETILNRDMGLQRLLLDSLGYYYLNHGREDKALDCFRKIEYTSTKANQQISKSVINGIALCYLRLGIRYKDISKYDISLDYENKALKIYQELGSKKGLANSYNNLGIIYINLDNNIPALENLLMALKLAKETGDEQIQGMCNMNIGLLYLNENDHTKSLYYNKAALRIFGKLKDNEGLLGCYNIIAGVYSEQGNYQNALENFYYAYKYSEKLKDELNKEIILNNIGDTYKNLGQFSTALEYFNKSLLLNKENNYKVTELYSLDDIADTYFKLRRYNDAKEYGLLTLKKAKEIEELNMENDAYRILNQIYSIEGNYKKAWEYGSLYKTTGDSLYNLEKSRKINEIQSRYETEEKELKITKLEKEKQIQSLNIEKLQEKKKNQLTFLLAIILCLFLIILLIYGVYKRFRLRQQNIKESELALQRDLRYKEVIEAQEKERKTIAENLHDSLGQMLSTIKLYMVRINNSRELVTKENREMMENTIDYLDSACDEVRNISHHLMPATLIRLGLIPTIEDLVNKINKTKNVEIYLKFSGFNERLEENIEINTYRIIQELIGNAIKHSQATNINIGLYRENKHISLKMTDNGKGFETSKIQQSEGIGWKNIYSRLEIINGKMNISSQIDKGTTININFAI